MFGGKDALQRWSIGEECAFSPGAAQRKRSERGSAREIEGDWGELPDRA